MLEFSEGDSSVEKVWYEVSRGRGGEVRVMCFVPEYPFEVEVAGYGGSDSADTALSILLHFLDVPLDTARAVYEGRASWDMDDQWHVDARLAWSCHLRLKAQKFEGSKDDVMVTGEELLRLMSTGRLA
jgi:hypothetical protein